MEKKPDMEILVADTDKAGPPETVRDDPSGPESSSETKTVGSSPPKTNKDYDKNKEKTWDETSQYLMGPKLAMMVCSMCLACFLVLLDTMIVSTAIPRITEDWSSTRSPILGGTQPLTSLGAPQPLSGKIFAHFNNKLSFLAFFLVFELGSAASSAMLIVGRAVAGVGAAGILNGALTIISCSVPLENRPKLIGIVMGFNQLGLVAGPLIGGAFTTYSTWRWCFYVNLPIGGVLILALLAFPVPEQSAKPPAVQVLLKLHKHLDLIGFCRVAPAVLQLILALNFGGVTHPWKSPHVIGLFCGSAATFVVWFFWNRYKGADALLPPAMVSCTAVWTSGLFQSFLMSAVYGAIFFLPIYFQAINDATPILSGVYFLPTVLSQLFVAATSGAIIMAIGYVIPLAVASTVLLSVASGLYSILRPNSPTGWWVGFQLIAGVGSGLGLQLAIISIQTVVSGKELSSAMAFLVFAQSLGPAIVLTLCQVIFYSTLRGELPKRAPGVDREAVIAAGATGFRKIVGDGDLAGVLEAYADGIDRVFYLVAAVAAARGLILWGMGWKDLRKKDARKDGTASASIEKEGKVVG
ncbi:major facilitator superfamily domain-containing protein [Cladorrhinum sp. PSN259]|nr:major facilitator superfamily domain-containing protein [Cladorrhinum sp. PSN259]